MRWRATWAAAIATVCAGSWVDDQYEWPVVTRVVIPGAGWTTTPGTWQSGAATGTLLQVTTAPSTWPSGSFLVVTDAGVWLNGTVEVQVSTREPSSTSHPAVGGPLVGTWLTTADGLHYGVVDTAGSLNILTCPPVPHPGSPTCGVEATWPAACLPGAGPSSPVVPVATYCNDVACQFWLGCARGLTVVQLDLVTKAWAPLLTDPTYLPSALAVSVDGSMVAAGNDATLRLYAANATSGPRLVRSDWVTNVTSGDGGVYDDATTALAWGRDGALYVGNPTCLNVLEVNGSVTRYAGVDGLPFGNITSLAITPGVLAPSQDVVWIGTTAGLARLVRSAGVPQPWRWMAGPRYLPIANTSGTASGATPTFHTPVTALTPLASTHVVALVPPAGWSVVSPTPVRLGDVAASMANALPQHDWLGMGLVADCALTTFGDVATCTAGPCESHGLWTGIQSAATAFQMATGDTSPTTLTHLNHWLGGLQFLINVTGITGLPARTVSPPWLPPPPPGGWWVNSTAYEHWFFMANTSSDSVTGHLFAYAMVSLLQQRGVVPLAGVTVNATQLLVDVVSYIVANNFTLIDVNGQPTRWGHWDPATLNTQRAWSDGRGVNSMQMLSYLAAVMAVAPPASPPAVQAQAAWLQLTQPGVDYAGNVVNLKIEAPIDDNYSDDELSFLPYAMVCMACNTPNLHCARDYPAVWQAIITSVTRTYNFVRRSRPSLWGVIYAACTGATGDELAAITSDVAWQLSNWQPEWVDWPVVNSNRGDIVLDPQPDRDGNYGTQSRAILPPNERGTYRWNSNPFQLNSGGVGMDVYEPGAFLLAYHMAVYVLGNK